MKKVLFSLALVATMALVSCGGADKAAAEKSLNDSLAQVAANKTADSIAALTPPAAIVDTTKKVVEGAAKAVEGAAKDAAKAVEGAAKTAGKAVEGAAKDAGKAVEGAAKKH